MGTFKDLDYFEWAKEMDVVSWDNYPGMDTPPSFTAMCHDLMRGIGGNKPFMLMEQTPNQQNWFPFCKVKRPGEVRKLSWQAVSHGADTVQFFQMKQSIGGCERFHGAVIAHDGTEQSRVFKETAALGGELDRIGKRIMGSEIRAKVAIMFDWQSYWSLEGCVGPTAGFSYPNEVHRFYRAFWRRNVPVDIIESTTPLDKLKQYDLVVAPALITVLPGVAETLESYVSEGGSFITGYMAGIHDEHDLVVPGGYPGKLRDLMGVWVEEIDALAPDETIRTRPSKCMATRLMPRARSWPASSTAKAPDGSPPMVAANSTRAIPRSPSTRTAKARRTSWARRWTRPV
jgi:beta-galactosidase